MRTILKTLPNHLEMRYDLKFSSEENTEILRQVIPHLVKALKRFKTTYKQIRDWLGSFHMHRRVQLLYKQRDTLDRDNQ